MGFLIFLLVVALIWLWAKLAEMSGQQTRMTEQLADAKDLLTELTGRVLRLERGTAAPIPSTPMTEATPMPAPAVAPEVAPVPVAAPSRHVVPPPPLVSSPRVEAPAPGSSGAAWSEPAPPAATSAAAAMPAVSASVAEAPATAERPESWEMTVGTSWLNKIGVLVFIVGVALLVGYSFNHVGPAGRVAIGFALSVGMLGSGIVLERRTAFRNYAYGLVAGGWAGVYFTTFAMHDVPAARIIESDLLAVSLLSLVAAGMIAHSLRYRSQIVTSLAFVVAYTTLALSPVSGFSLAASVPLAVALLVVSQRLGWAGVSALGIVATYGAFALRGAIFPEVLNPHSALPYVMLATYWLAFEAADITGLRSRAGAWTAGPVPVPMMALNATGFMGALILTVPPGHPAWLSVLLFTAGSAYVVSAVVRAHLLPGWNARHAMDEPFDTTHGATAIAAVLFAIAIDLRFAGNRETLALLLLAQLLVTAGFTLGDVWLRRMGSVGIAVAAAYALDPGGETGVGALDSSWPISSANAVLVLIAAACYGNREALYRRDAQPVWVEPVFTWIAAALVSIVIMRELDPAHQTLAGLAVAVLLLEVGFRRSKEYIHQSYVIGGFASYGMLAAFLAPPTAAGMLATWGVAPTSIDEWIVLPAGVLLTAVAAWRLSSRADDAAVPGATIAAATAGAVSTALLMLFKWRVLPELLVAPAWAATGLALVAIGMRRSRPVQRWQGQAMVAIGGIRVMQLLIAQPLDSGELGAASALSISTAVVIALIYATAWVTRRAAADDQDPAAIVLPVLGTLALVLLQFYVVADLGRGPAWTATAAVLLGFGLWQGAADLRWQGYALLAFGAWHTSQPVLAAPDTTSTAIAWLVGVIAIVYVCGLGVRRMTRDADTAGEPNPTENAVGAAQLLGATTMLAMLILQEVRPSMVTLALGLQGLGLMFAGLIARERVMRLSGLGLLLGCILKLFVYDLREREAMERIMSFVILGLFLLAISWTYTRYREQIRKFL